MIKKNKKKFDYQSYVDGKVDACLFNIEMLIVTSIHAFGKKSIMKGMKEVLKKVENIK